MDFSSFFTEDMFTELNSVLEESMWMSAAGNAFHYAGAAVLIIGVIFACIKKKKIWHIATGIGGGMYAAGVILSMVFMASVTYQISHEMLIPSDTSDSFLSDIYDSGYDGGGYDFDYDYSFDAHDGQFPEYSSYSHEYTVGDGWYVIMALNAEDGFIDMYSAYDDTWMCTLDYGEYTNAELPNTFIDSFIEIYDYNSDGYADIGIYMENGELVRYLYDADFYYFFHESLF